MLPFVADLLTKRCVADWPHTVTDESDSFAQELDKAYQKHLKGLSSSAPSNGSPGKRRCLEIGGFGDGYSADGTERDHALTLLCGSTRTVEFESHSNVRSQINGHTYGQPQSTLIFPDYKVRPGRCWG